jgi:hypothetical protein
MLNDQYLKVTWRDWFNLCTQLLFNLIKIKAIFISDEIDSETKMTKSATSADSVQIRFGVLRKVKIDDHVHRLYVYSACKEIFGLLTSKGGKNVPEQTKFLQAPLLKSWKTLFL